MLAGVILDGLGGAAVGVALAQDGVDGAALDLVVAGLGVLLGVGLGGLGVVGKRVAVFLQLDDGGLQLGHGGADVGQLDDVGLGLEGEGAQFGKVVSDLLGGAQQFGEERQDAAGE